MVDENKFSDGGAEEIVNALEKKLETLGDPNGIAKTIALFILIPYIEENFGFGGYPVSEGVDSRKSWKELAESTIKNRRTGEGEGDHKILNDTGSLLLSFKDSSAFRSTFDGKKLIIYVGTSIVYAAIHNYGGKIKIVRGQKSKDRAKKSGKKLKSNITIPKRPFLRFGRQPIIDSNRLLNEYILE